MSKLKLQNNKGEIATTLTVLSLFVMLAGVFVGGFNQPKTLENRADSGSCIYNTTAIVQKALPGGGVTTFTKKDDNNNKVLSIKNDKQPQSFDLSVSDSSKTINNPNYTFGGSNPYKDGDTATVTLSGLDEKWRVKDVFCNPRVSGAKGCDLNPSATGNRNLSIKDFHVVCGVDIQYGWIVELDPKAVPTPTSIVARPTSQVAQPIPTNSRLPIFPTGSRFPVLPGDPTPTPVTDNEPRTISGTVHLKGPIPSGAQTINVSIMNPGTVVIAQKTLNIPSTYNTTNDATLPYSVVVNTTGLNKMTALLDYNFNRGQIDTPRTALYKATVCTNGRTNSNNCIWEPLPTSTSLTASFDATFVPAPQAGSCNQSCVKNSDCAAGLSCYTPFYCPVGTSGCSYCTGASCTPTPTTSPVSNCRIRLVAQITDKDGKNLNLTTADRTNWKYEAVSSGNVDTFGNGFRSSYLVPDANKTNSLGKLKLNDSVQWTLKSYNQGQYKLLGNNVRICQIDPNDPTNDDPTKCTPVTGVNMDNTLSGSRLDTGFATLGCERKIIAGWWFEALPPTPTPTPQAQFGDLEILTAVTENQSEVDTSSRQGVLNKINTKNSGWYQMRTTSNEKGDYTIIIKGLAGEFRSNSPTGGFRRFSHIPVGTYQITYDLGSRGSSVEISAKTKPVTNGVLVESNKTTEATIVWKARDGIRLETETTCNACKQRGECGPVLGGSTVLCALKTDRGGANPGCWCTNKSYCEAQSDAKLGKAVWQNDQGYCDQSNGKAGDGLCCLGSGSKPSCAERGLPEGCKDGDKKAPGGGSGGAGAGKCQDGNNKQPGQECDNTNKCDIAGGCNPDCGANGEIRGDKKFDVPNGYCRKGFSGRANDGSEQIYETCVNNACTKQVCPAGRSCVSNCDACGGLRGGAGGGGDTRKVVPTPVSSLCDTSGGSCYSGTLTRNFCTGESGGLILLGQQGCPANNVCCRPNKKTPLCELPNSGPGGICTPRVGSPANTCGNISPDYKAAGQFECPATQTCCVNTLIKGKDTPSGNAKFTYNLDVCKVPNNLFRVSVPGVGDITLVDPSRINEILGNVMEITYCEQGTKNCVILNGGILSVASSGSNQSIIKGRYETFLKKNVTYTRRLSGKGVLSGYVADLPPLKITDNQVESIDLTDRCHDAANAILKGANNNPNLICNTDPKGPACYTLCQIVKNATGVTPGFCTRTGPLQNGNVQVKLNGFAPSNATRWLSGVKAFDKSGKAVYNKSTRQDISALDNVFTGVPANNPDIVKYQIWANVLDNDDAIVGSLTNSCGGKDTCDTTSFKNFVQFNIVARPSAGEIKFTYSIKLAYVPNAIFGVPVPGFGNLQLVSLDDLNQIVGNSVSIEFCEKGTRSCRQLALSGFNREPNGATKSLLQGGYAVALKKGTTYTRTLEGRGVASGLGIRPLPELVIPDNSGDLIESLDYTNDVAIAAEDLVKGIRDNKAFLCNNKPLAGICAAACTVKSIIPFPIWWCGEEVKPQAKTTIHGKITNNCTDVKFDQPVTVYMTSHEPGVTDFKQIAASSRITIDPGKSAEYTVSFGPGVLPYDRSAILWLNNKMDSRCIDPISDSSFNIGQDNKVDFEIKSKAGVPPVQNKTTVHGIIINNCPGFTYKGKVDLFKKSGSTLQQTSTFDIPYGITGGYELSTTEKDEVELYVDANYEDLTGSTTCEIAPKKQPIALKSEAVVNFVVKSKLPQSSTYPNCSGDYITDRIDKICRPIKGIPLCTSARNCANNLESSKKPTGNKGVCNAYPEALYCCKDGDVLNSDKSACIPGGSAPVYPNCTGDYIQNRIMKVCEKKDSLPLCGIGLYCNGDTGEVIPEGSSKCSIGIVDYCCKLGDILNPERNKCIPNPVGGGGGTMPATAKIFADTDFDAGKTVPISFVTMNAHICDAGVAEEDVTSCPSTNVVLTDPEPTSDFKYHAKTEKIMNTGKNYDVWIIATALGSERARAKITTISNLSADYEITGKMIQDAIASGDQGFAAGLFVENNSDKTITDVMVEVCDKTTNACVTKTNTVNILPDNSVNLRQLINTINGQQVSLYNKYEMKVTLGYDDGSQDVAGVSQIKSALRGVEDIAVGIDAGNTGATSQIGSKLSLSDCDGDNRINATDLEMIASIFGQKGANIKCDTDLNSQIDALDVSNVLRFFSREFALPSSSVAQ